MNVRGLNQDKKQKHVQDICNSEQIDIMLLCETKLTRVLNLQGLSVQQSIHQRNGGCAVASATKLHKVKSLGTYLCWTKTLLRNTWVHVISCYLQPGEQRHLRERAKRVIEIVDDLVKQDGQAVVILGGDFNNHLPHVETECLRLNMHKAFDDGVASHVKGNLLDQVFVRNAQIDRAVMSGEIDLKVSDHRCLRVDLQLGIN